MPAQGCARLRRHVDVPRASGWLLELWGAFLHFCTSAHCSDCLCNLSAPSGVWKGTYRIPKTKFRKAVAKISSEANSKSVKSVGKSSPAFRLQTVAIEPPTSPTFSNKLQKTLSCPGAEEDNRVLENNFITHCPRRKQISPPISVIVASTNMERRNSFDEASAGFRAHLPDLSNPRFISAAKQNVYEYVKSMQDNRAPPWLYDLTRVWEKLLEEPYKGITNDGNVRKDLYEARDEAFDIGNVVKKAERLLGALDERHRSKIRYNINAREWRAWSNPEFLLRPFGVRLEEGTKY